MARPKIKAKFRSVKKTVTLPRHVMRALVERGRSQGFPTFSAYLLDVATRALMLVPCAYKDGSGVYCARPAMIDPSSGKAAHEHGYCAEHAAAS